MGFALISSVRWGSSSRLTTNILSGEVKDDGHTDPEQDPLSR